jgi:hypothetical protein
MKISKIWKRLVWLLLLYFAFIYIDLFILEWLFLIPFLYEILYVKISNASYQFFPIPDIFKILNYENIEFFTHKATENTSFSLYKE